MKSTPNTVRYHNTLHGFNPFVKDFLAIGIIYPHIPINVCEYTKSLTETSPCSHACSYQCNSCLAHRESLVKVEELQAHLQRELNITTIEVDDWLGRDFLKIKPEDRDRIPEAINAVLKWGYAIRLQTRLSDTNYYPGDTFSIEESERKAVEMYKYCLPTLGKLLFEGDCTTGVYGDERLWKTEVGKEFARFILDRNPEARKSAEGPYYLLELDNGAGLNPLIDFPLISTHDSNGVLKE